MSKSQVNVLFKYMRYGSIGFALFCLFLAFKVGHTAPTWVLESTSLNVESNIEGKLYYTYKGKPKYIEQVKPIGLASLRQNVIEECNFNKTTPPVMEEYVFSRISSPSGYQTVYYKLQAKKHWKFWSLLPALVAILLCWVIREPITALFGGIVTGAFLLGKYDLLETVFLPQFMTKSAAGILILYLWLLGGLMGIWARTGAAQAFAELMTKHVVRGPKSAKLVAWMLGIIFFQGGTVSTVLVGTTVKPLTDKEKISHEELSYIVDSTASPIASIIAFNAWPGYVQAFIYVSGVSFLATEADRVAFFFKSIPLSFYCIFAVLGTFLLSIDKSPFLGKKMAAAIKRSRETGQLNAPDAEPLSSKELECSNVPEGYTPHVIDFFIPLALLIGTAIGTYLFTGSLQIRWAFGLALLSGILLAAIRGMSIRDIVSGLENGFKGVVLGSVILLLAMTLGSLSKEAGGGIYLVDLLGGLIPYILLPVCLQLLTIIISFSTGTSWGTYAVAFPLAMPLAWSVSQANGLSNPELYMMVCFAAVMNGSVFGDQCSPISDTTVLSSMCTGSDLMDHVKTQITQCAVWAVLAGVGWTAVVFLFA